MGNCRIQQWNWCRIRALQREPNIYWACQPLWQPNESNDDDDNDINQKEACKRISAMSRVEKKTTNKHIAIDDDIILLCTACTHHKAYWFEYVCKMNQYSARVLCIRVFFFRIAVSLDGAFVFIPLLPIVFFNKHKYICKGICAFIVFICAVTRCARNSYLCVGEWVVCSTLFFFLLFSVSLSLSLGVFLCSICTSIACAHCIHFCLMR